MRRISKPPACKLGGALADVVVQGTDADNYTINFGGDSNMQAQPELAVVDAAWNSGFLPAQASVVSEPATIGLTATGAPSIPVSPTNPALTAAAIQQAFLSTTQTILIAPSYGDVHPADPPLYGGPATQVTSVQVVVTPGPRRTTPTACGPSTSRLSAATPTTICRRWSFPPAR